jgi:hypothetical protein
LDGIGERLGYHHKRPETRGMDKLLEGSACALASRWLVHLEDDG